MNNRQLKKRSKKAAEAIGYLRCWQDEDGTWLTSSGNAEYGECDAEDSFEWVAKRFDGEVNTFIDPDNEWGGISYKPENEILPLTPRNVLPWARQQDWHQQKNF